MWLWLISSIAASILGGAVGSWFADSRLCECFYINVDNIAYWAAYNYIVSELVYKDSYTFTKASKDASSILKG